MSSKIFYASLIATLGSAITFSFECDITVWLFALLILLVALPVLVFTTYRDYKNLNTEKEQYKDGDQEDVNQKN